MLTSPLVACLYSPYSCSKLVVGWLLLQCLDTLSGGLEVGLKEQRSRIETAVRSAADEQVRVGLKGSTIVGLTTCSDMRVDRLRGR